MDQVPTPWEENDDAQNEQRDKELRALFERTAPVTDPVDVEAIVASATCGAGSGSRKLSSLPSPLAGRRGLVAAGTVAACFLVAILLVRRDGGSGSPEPIEVVAPSDTTDETVLAERASFRAYRRALSESPDALVKLIDMQAMGAARSGNPPLSAAQMRPWALLEPSTWEDF